MPQSKDKEPDMNKFATKFPITTELPAVPAELVAELSAALAAALLESWGGIEAISTSSGTTR